MGLAIYPAFLAYDPATGQAVPGVAATVTDPLTGIPLETLDLTTGQPRQIFTNHKGHVEGFMVEDGPGVALVKVGSYGQGVPDLTMSVDMRDAALQAAQAAIDAANLVEAPADTVVKTLVEGESLTSAAGDERWLTRDDAETSFIRAVEATRVYVRTSGSNSNDGLTPSTAFRTVAHAVSMAEKNAQRTDTNWIIDLESGTYRERIRFAQFTPFAVNLEICGADVGGHPNVPTTVFTEAPNGVSAAAITVRNPAAVVTIRDIKFTGYNGNTSSQGINASQGMVITRNVHAENCFWGASMIHGDIDVKGGIYDNCGRVNGDGGGNGGGVRSLMLTRHSIGTQNAGTNAEGPIFRNCRNGVFIQESSTGHVDYCTFENNEYGLTANVNSRANADGSKFTNNGTAIRASGGSNVYVSANTTFGTGAEANGIPMLQSNFGYISWNIAGVNGAYAPVESTITGDYDLPVLTGSTTATSVVSKIISAPYFAGNEPYTGVGKRKLRVSAKGRIIGAGGSKNIHLNFGGSTVATVFTAGQQGEFIWEGEVIFTGTNTQFISCSSLLHLSNARTASSVAGLDMSIDQNLSLRVTLENASDSVKFHYVEIVST